jgi:hypothetical protein
MDSSVADDVIVWEATGYWTRALRRYLPASIGVTQHPADWCGQSAEGSAAINVLEVPLELGADACRWIQSLRGRRPTPLTLAVVRPADHSVAWQLRMAGAAAVWDELWQVPAICQLIERFCRRATRADLSLERQIWNNLPWAGSCRDRLKPDTGDVGHSRH